MGQKLSRLIAKDTDKRSCDLESCNMLESHGVRQSDTLKHEEVLWVGSINQ